MVERGDILSPQVWIKNASCSTAVYQRFTKDGSCAVCWPHQILQDEHMESKELIMACAIHPRAGRAT